MNRFVTGFSALLVAASLALVPTSAEARAQAQVSITIVDSTPTYGETVTVQGAVQPGRVKNNVVKIQYNTEGAWTNVTSAKVSSRSFTANVVLPQAYAVEYRAVGRDASSGKRVVSNAVLLYPKAPAEPEPEPLTYEESVQLILDDTNEYRAQHNMPPLAIHPDLQQIAQSWSEQMAAEGKMYHNPNYAGQYPAGWQAAAENIAYYYSVQKIVDAWYNSDVHRTNLVGDYNYIGIGIAFDSRGYPYYTQNFARY